jgi:SAM-dependent methyltransferase
MGLPGRELAYHPDYSALERLYIRIFGAPVNGLRIRLAHVMPATRGDYRRILDAGCGRGTFSLELAKAHPDAEVVGVDLDNEALAKASCIAEKAGLGNLRFRVADVTALPFEDEFDLVVSVDNLEHVEDDVTAMRCLRKALTHRGRLVVHVPGYYRRWPMFRKSVNFDVPGHMRPGYRIEELEEKLSRAGFTVESTRPTYGFLENLSNNISYAITGAEQKNKALYALAFPFLLIMSSLGASARPTWGAGVLAVASVGGTSRTDDLGRTVPRGAVGEIRRPRD